MQKVLVLGATSAVAQACAKLWMQEGGKVVSGGKKQRYVAGH